MIPQLQILPPLSPTEAAPALGQSVVDVEFSDIFKTEKATTRKTDPLIDSIAPNLLQVMLLPMPPVSSPSSGQHAVLAENSADFLAPASTDQMPFSALLTAPTTETGATTPDFSEPDAEEIGAASGAPKLPQIQPQAWHGALPPAMTDKATTDPNQPLQTTAPLVERDTDQDVPPTAAGVQLAAEMAQVLPEPMALAAVAPITGAKIILQTGPSSRQVATISRAIIESETVAPTETATEKAKQSACDHSDKTGDITASGDQNLPDIVGPDLQISDTTPPDATLNKNSVIAASIVNLAQIVPPTRPPPPQVLPEGVAPMIIEHATLPESGPVEVVLNPQELGHLRFKIHHDGDQVNVVLTVERPDTLDLVRRHVGQLLGDLRQAGFSDATLSFGQWQQSDSSANRQAPLLLEEQTARDPPTPVFSPAPPWPVRPDLGGQGLNLRL